MWKGAERADPVAARGWKERGVSLGVALAVVRRVVARKDMMDRWFRL